MNEFETYGQNFNLIKYLEGRHVPQMACQIFYFGVLIWKAELRYSWAPKLGQNLSQDQTEQKKQNVRKQDTFVALTKLDHFGENRGHKFLIAVSNP